MTMLPTSSLQTALSPKERRRFARRQFLRRLVLPVISRPFAVTLRPALIFSPHQDDETLGCGALIAHKRLLKVPVTVVFVTDGGQSRGDVPPDERAALIAEREQEALVALATLGVGKSDVHFWRFPDGNLSQLPADAKTRFQKNIENMVKTSHPGEIYLPHRRDSHPDHEATFALVQNSLRQLSVNAVIYQYMVWLLWSRNNLFSTLRPTDLAGSLRLAVSPEIIAQKQEAMNAYPTQIATLPIGFVGHLLDDSEYYFKDS